MITFTHRASALVLPVVGAFADRSASRSAGCSAGSRGSAPPPRPPWCSSPATNWQLGAAAAACRQHRARGQPGRLRRAPVRRSPAPDERDAVSSRAWAFGYLGGGLLLAVNLALVTSADALAGCPPGLGGADLPGDGRSVVGGVHGDPLPRGSATAPPRALPTRRTCAGRSLVRRSFGQLATTLREARGYPMTLTVPGRVPVLQRRHPDRDRRRERLRDKEARVQPSRC